MISYAQNLEDVLLYRALKDVPNGFYIDIGARDPLIGSTTKSFYDRGWRGINIEPGPLFGKLASSRPEDINLKLAVRDFAGEVTLLAREVECDTLTNIIAKHAPELNIDFLKIDADGNEGAIVKSTDWRRIRPKIIVAKSTAPSSNTLNNQDWESILLSSGYVRAYFNGTHCFYVREEDGPLANAFFASSIEPVDGITRYDAAFEMLAKQATDYCDVLEKVRAQLSALERLKFESAHYTALHPAEEARSQVNERARRYDELITSLRCDDVPSSLQLVLPLARGLRAITRALPPLTYTWSKLSTRHKKHSSSWLGRTFRNPINASKSALRSIRRGLGGGKPKPNGMETLKGQFNELMLELRAQNNKTADLAEMVEAVLVSVAASDNGGKDT